MSTKLSNHVDERGALPKIKITNWGSYIAFTFKFGDHESTSFVYPAATETTGQHIARIRAEFVNLDVTVENPDDYS
jgi:hypothetical protein